MKIFTYLVNIRFILPNEKDNTLTPFIAPSILSADFARLGEEVNAVLDAGADIIHFDVMDNRFVPNLTIGPLVCQSLRDFGVKAPIDVHLMAEPVDNLILDFSKAGASYISFHPEASRHGRKDAKLAWFLVLPLHSHGSNILSMI